MEDNPKINVEIDVTEIKYLGEVQRLNLQKEDVLVLSLAEIISDEVSERIKAKIEALVPGRKVLILSQGSKIGVIHKVKR
jgi:hypothetical protein